MHEAKSQLFKLGEKAWAGENVVITKSGKPYLDLLPHKDERAPREPGRCKGQIEVPTDIIETPEEIITTFESAP
jgi:antitoxin (DNA-binding transcriptional repressor) of toxin-antitoxin stability system